ncbi:MAG: hypothetical protein ACJ72M_19800 [Propionibacteriaceae bacterium]
MGHVDLDVEKAIVAWQLQRVRDNPAAHRTLSLGENETMAH